MKPPKIIAEIGCNHKGDMDIALELIDTAAHCKVAGVKFQKRCIRELLTDKEYNVPHPCYYNSYGKTYGEHRQHLEFTLSQHRRLQARCKKLGIMYGCSVWDCSSAKEIATLEPDFMKIPSAMNCCTELLRTVIEVYAGPIHVSLGMTTRAEEKRIVEYFKLNKRLGDLVLYICTSSYPAQNDEICLLDISRLKREYPGIPIGNSGHHKGLQLDMAAVTLGAEWLERHFTEDRSWKGTDHAASMEYDGLRRLVRDTAIIAAAMKEKDQFSEREMVQRKKLKKYSLNLVSTRNSS